MRKLTYSAILLTIALTVDARTGVSGDAASVTLSNDHVSARFDAGKTFDILSLKSADGKESVKPGLNTKPWTLTYRGAQGQTPELDSSCAVYKGYRTVQNDTSATVVFSWNTRLLYDGND